MMANPLSSTSRVLWGRRGSGRGGPVPAAAEWRRRRRPPSPTTGRARRWGCAAALPGVAHSPSLTVAPPSPGPDRSPGRSIMVHGTLESDARSPAPAPTVPPSPTSTTTGTPTSATSTAPSPRWATLATDGPVLELGVGNRSARPAAHRRGGRGRRARRGAGDARAAPRQAGQRQRRHRVRRHGGSAVPRRVVLGRPGGVQTPSSTCPPTTDQRRCLAQTRRVLRPGGVLVIEAFAPPDGGLTRRRRRGARTSPSTPPCSP